MKTGLLLSRDGGTISEVVDIEAIAKKYSHLPAVKVYNSFFTYEDQQDILKTVQDNNLECVVLAGNSPKYFDSVLGGTRILEELKDCGINENRIGIANILEQVALPHKDQKKDATKKAKLLIDVALAKVEMTRDIKTMIIAPRKSVLIVGTTPGGVVAAKNFLEKDYRVYMIDKGRAFSKQTTKEKEILPALSAVQAHDKVSILLNADVKDISGWCGGYKVVLTTDQEDEEILVGGIIVAVGNDLEWIRKLRPKMQLDVNDEGYLRGKHGSGIPGQTNDPGIWFIPPSDKKDRLAKDISIAGIAVLSITTVLDKNEIDHPVMISEVNEKVCGGCGTCVKTCPFAASSIDTIRKVSVIDMNRCKGCGNCVVSCPTGARDLITFPEDYIRRAINILAEGISTNGDPKVLAVLCSGCGYAAADTAGEMAKRSKGLIYSPNVLPIRVECGGNVDTQYILDAFKMDFDGVAISVCPDKCCHHVVGNTDMQRRLGLFRDVLRSRHIDAERLRIINVAQDDGKTFVMEINEFCKDLKAAKATGRKV